MINKKAQAWGFDLIIASTIFLGAIVAFYLFTINSSNETEDIYASLSYDGNNIADSLISEGYPSDWNSTNVIKIGLAKDQKINDTLLERFYLLSQTDYPRTKQLFNTKYNYYINLSTPMILNGDNVEYVGFKSENKTNLIKINRVVIYKNKPASLYVHIWN